MKCCKESGPTLIPCGAHLIPTISNLIPMTDPKKTEINKPSQNSGHRTREFWRVGQCHRSFDPGPGLMVYITFYFSFPTISPVHLDAYYCYAIGL